MKDVGDVVWTEKAQGDDYFPAVVHFDMDLCFVLRQRQELSRESLIQQGQPDEVIEQSGEITRKFFWVFPFIGIAAYALFGAIVGAIGASVFKK